MYVSTTVSGYKSKPNLAECRWECKYLTTNEIVDLLKQGYSLSQNFYTSSSTGLFTQKERTKELFKSSPFVFIDLDDFPNTWETMLNSLKMQPTIAYTTFRHHLFEEKTGKPFGNRYRLIYFFKDEIKTISTYKACYDALLCQTGLFDYVHSQLEKNQEDNAIIKIKKIVDQHANSGVLACHGTNSDNPDFHIINTHKIYNLCDLDLQNGKSIIIKKEGRSNLRTFPICSPQYISHEMKKDSEDLDYYMWYHKYHTKYKFIDRVEKDDWVNGKWQWLAQRYFKLRYIPIKLKDGNNRRKQLHTRTMLRRVIAPSATPDELYFNIIVDFHKFINNNEDAISYKQLVLIVESAFKKSPETIAQEYASVIKTLQKKNPRCNIILKRGTYKCAADYNRRLSKVRREQVLELYDSNLTMAKNVEKLAANRIKITERTLRKYLGDMKHSEAKNDEIEVLIDVSQSLTWNFKNLKAHGRSVNWNKLKRLYQKKVDISAMTEK